MLHEGPGQPPSLCWGLSDAQISLVSGSSCSLRVIQGRVLISSPWGAHWLPSMRALEEHICWAGEDSCL